MLLIEVFKCMHKLNPELMWDILQPKTTGYNLRNGSLLIVPRAKNSIGLNSFQFRATLAWNNLPAHVKNITDLNRFKSAIKSVPIHCQCKLCIAHLQPQLH